MNKFFHIVSAGILSGVFLSGCNSSSSSSSSSSVAIDEVLITNDGSDVVVFGESGDNIIELSRVSTKIVGSYSRTGNTVTIQSYMRESNLTGIPFTFDFQSTDDGEATDGTYPVELTQRVGDLTTLTITDSVSGDIASGTVLIEPNVTLSGTYTQAANGDVTFTRQGLHEIYPGSNNISIEGMMTVLSGGAPDGAFVTNGVTADDTIVLERATIKDELGDPIVYNEVSGEVEITFYTNYSHFGFVKHPTIANTFYTTSLYSCPWGGPLCWANAFVHQFSVDKSGQITLIETYPLPEGANAPTALAINDSGTHMVIHDDDYDDLILSTLDADGNLSAPDQMFSHSSGEASMHGLSIVGDTVYNCANIWTLNSLTDELDKVNVNDTGGNSSVVIGDNIFCSDGNRLSFTNVSVPNVPATTVIDTEDFTSIANWETKEIMPVTSGDDSMFVVAGICGLKTVAWDGAAFIETTPASGSSELVQQGCDSLDLDGFDRNTKKAFPVFRDLAVNSDGNTYASAYFGINYADWLLDDVQSGVTLFEISEDGQIDPFATLEGLSVPRISSFMTLQ